MPGMKEFKPVPGLFWDNATQTYRLGPADGAFDDTPIEDLPEWVWVADDSLPGGGSFAPKEA